MATDESSASHKQGALIPESHKDILESNGMANVATIGPKGEPQVNPVWFDWDGQKSAVQPDPGQAKAAQLKA